MPSTPEPPDGPRPGDRATDPGRAGARPERPAPRALEPGPARAGGPATGDAGSGGAGSGDAAAGDAGTADRARRDGSGRRDTGRPETGRRDTRQHDTRQHDTVPVRQRRPGPDDRATVRVDTDAHRATVRLDRAAPPAAAPVRRAPLPVAAAFATCWAALWSYVPVAAVIGVARTMEGAGGLAGAARTGLAGWLLGHGVPIGTPSGPLALTPLLLGVLVLWRLHQAGLHVTRAVGARHSRAPRDALRVAVAVGAVYALLGALAAAVVDAPGSMVAAPRAAGTLFAVGALGALPGALRGTDTLAVLARRTPPVLRHAVRTGVVAALLVLAAGAAFAGLAVALGGGRATDTIAAYRTGVAGQAGITLVSLAYGGNAAVWAASYLLGPGFTLGTGTAVGITGVALGPLPALPLLAGLPSGALGAAGAALLAVPVLAGMAAGAACARRLAAGRRGRPPAPPGWPLLLGATAGAGPVAGLLLGAAAQVSGGSLGTGRLAQLGPVPWQVAAVAAAVVAVSAPLGAAATRALRPPRG